MTSTDELTPKRKKRKVWALENRFLRPSLHNVDLFKKLSEEPPDFLDALKINVETYLQLLDMLKPYIERKNTMMRESITAHERLSATLQVLSLGMTYKEVEKLTNISATAIACLVPDACDAMCKALTKKYLNFPTSTEEWQAIASDFDKTWDFPNCGGALDARHIAISTPSGNPDFFKNHKDYYSLILMALVNANYEFVMIDVGKNGNHYDGSVLEETLFYEKLIKNDLNLPDKNLTKENLNFVFVADQSFALHENILKAYPESEDLDLEKRISNFRINRALKPAEGAFGIMAARFKIFHNPIRFNLDRADKVIASCCLLHNFFMKTQRETYCPVGFLDIEDFENGCILNGTWRQLFDVDTVLYSPLKSADVDCTSLETFELQRSYTEYFTGPGCVSWQDKMLYSSFLDS